MNARQVKLANRLLDGFEGKLITAKWAAPAKYSTDTALRKLEGGGGVRAWPAAVNLSTAFPCAPAHPDWPT
jgi:hypothetical protein